MIKKENCTFKKSQYILSNSIMGVYLFILLFMVAILIILALTTIGLLIGAANKKILPGWVVFIVFFCLIIYTVSVLAYDYGTTLDTLEETFQKIINLLLVPYAIIPLILYYIIYRKS